MSSKISELTPATALLPGDELPIRRGAANFRLPGSAINSLKPRGAVLGYDVVDDFLTGLVFFKSGTSSTGGSSLSDVWDVPGYDQCVGAWKLNTGSGTDAEARLSTNSWYWNPVIRFNASGALRFGCRVILPDLSDATNSFRFRLGLNNAGNTPYTGIDYTHSVHSGRFRCFTNGTEIPDSGVTVAANTWYTLEVIGNASLVDFYINGAKIGSGISTNIPASDQYELSPVINKLGGTSARAAYLDWFAVGKTL
jgi:hypothetical protein